MTDDPERHLSRTGTARGRAGAGGAADGRGGRPLRLGGDPVGGIASATTWAVGLRSGHGADELASAYD